MRDDRWPALTWESPPTSRHITIISALIPLTTPAYCRTVTQPNLRNALTTDTDTAAGRRVAAAECSEVAGAELIILLKIFSHFLPARRQQQHQPWGAQLQWTASVLTIDMEQWLQWSWCCHCGRQIKSWSGDDMMWILIPGNVRSCSGQYIHTATTDVARHFSAVCCRN